MFCRLSMGRELGFGLIMLASLERDLGIILLLTLWREMGRKLSMFGLGGGVGRCQGMLDRNVANRHIDGFGCSRYTYCGIMMLIDFERCLPVPG